LITIGGLDHDVRRHRLAAQALAERGTGAGENL
jgi:hypothetical protein